MRTSACPTPTRCGVTSHVAGTAAARACTSLAPAQRRSGAPLPVPGEAPAPDGLRDLGLDLDSMSVPEITAASMAQALREVLDPITDDGWVPGTVHPTGGYDGVDLQTGEGAWEGEVVFSRGGQVHRGDGPAVLGLAAFGHGPVARVRERRWYLAGALHRVDGPAVEPEGGAPAFWLRGEGLAVRGTQLQVLQRVEDLQAMGARGLTGWMAYEVVAGARATRSLVRAGVDGEVAHRCALAGVVGAKAMLAVGSRRAPLSWAAPGA